MGSSAFNDQLLSLCDRTIRNWHYAIYGWLQKEDFCIESVLIQSIEAGQPYRPSIRQVHLVYIVLSINGLSCSAALPDVDYFFALL